jgi:hypothetical protein
MTGVFVTFAGAVVVLFAIGLMYGWISEWRRRRR